MQCNLRQQYKSLVATKEEHLLPLLEAKGTEKKKGTLVGLAGNHFSKPKKHTKGWH